MLGGKLEKLNREVHEGCGFVVLRGLDPRFYNQEENVMIYLGLSSYAGGEKRGRQTTDGAKLGSSRIPVSCHPDDKL